MREKKRREEKGEKRTQVLTKKSTYPPPAPKTSKKSSKSTELKSVKNNLELALFMVDRAIAEPGDERVATLLYAEDDIRAALRSLKSYFSWRSL